MSTLLKDTLSNYVSACFALLHLTYQTAVRNTMQVLYMLHSQNCFARGAIARISMNFLLLWSLFLYQLLSWWSSKEKITYLHCSKVTYLNTIMYGFMAQTVFEGNY